MSDVERRWHKHMKPFFGGRRSNEITTEYVKQYVSKRLNNGAQNGTVNRELAVLRRMYSLALCHTPPKVNPNRVPQIAGLGEGSPRAGFIVHEEFKRLLEFHEEPWWRALLMLAYQ